VRSLLRSHGLRTGFPAKTGLYTSPDLRCIRERIQLDDQPITKDAFAKYFFEVWDGLSGRILEATEDTKRLPRYLQLLALLALHTFIREQTEVVILETHHGGEYDATNVIQRPAVTGITPIGMDHVAQLGPTLESIAWHKAGIFKHGTPAFSAPQDPQTAAVLQTRAVEKSVELTFVPVDTTLSTNTQSLTVPVQRMNCSLAIAISNAFLKRKTSGSQHVLTQSDIAEGIENFSWPGRFETIQEGQCSWFLDGAHNELSVKQAAMWFAQVTTGRTYVFFCPSSPLIP
jgi:folylpolyglutamate synthase